MSSKNQRRVSTSPRRRANRTESKLDALTRTPVGTTRRSSLFPPMAWKTDGTRWQYVKL